MKKNPISFDTQNEEVQKLLEALYDAGTATAFETITLYLADMQKIIEEDEIVTVQRFGGSLLRKRKNYKYTVSERSSTKSGCEDNGRS